MTQQITQRFIKQNYSSRNGTPIYYIVIHDTGNTSKGADAYAHYRYFNSGYRAASAHYFVDDHSIIQTVDERHSAWHVGDGKGRYHITNRNSIGVELCINSDGNIEKTKENGLWLIRNLMEKYNFSRHRVVRHWNASRKICPRIFSGNEWHDWWDYWAQI
ncbi:MAG: N-acetylmuramoyl-L-alanine amidase [Tissierellia bacterium]|nr:N-acetylmuramoyl-L-alanine amidase [Tissierellia bacterium]